MPEPLSESSGPVQSVRRAVTLPTKLNPQAQRGSAAPNLSENVIFYHPSAKIVHFAPRALVPIPSSSAPSDFDYPVDTIETLPWRSATERTVATAPLRLERGLTVFLKCGNVVRAILKNSQCWCVDGVSKFVLRIRPLTYYRIELPNETAEDKALVEDLKAALPTVLRYEVTPCPFKRAFTVDLPEEAMAPRRKKAWKPKERKDGVSSLSGSNQGLFYEGRSDWLDSASTGDDTDGAATDDSGFSPQRANSTTSEAVPISDESPVFTTDGDISSHPAPSKREIKETPQTFTSLRANFNAAPALEGLSATEQPGTTEVIRPLDSESTRNEPLVEDSNHSNAYVISTEPVESEEASKMGDAFKSQDPSATEVILELPATVQKENSSSNEFQDHAAPSVATNVSVPEDTSSTVPSEVTSSPIPVPISEGSDREPAHQVSSVSQEVSIQAQTSAPTDISVPEETPMSKDLISERVPGSLEKDSGSEPDHDSSFASSPESFHSVEIPSFRVEHPSLASHMDAASRLEPSVATSVAKFAAKQASIDRTPGTKQLPRNDVIDVHHSQESESNASLSELRMPKYIVREDPPKKPSSSISSSKKLAAVDATFPVTDFHHMSTEFRRRAQATRRRDVSPMPPSSAVYQPPPNDHASSLLSKALSLVLVPPIHLFIILLHVAARIVISPARSSNLVDFSSGSQSPSHDPGPEDDFSFPLERESSSEYEDAEMSRKLNPWDLD
ncbi:hypothetical protein F1880_009057 [Penicillium rolfsii]|nr:hypothetical protein F1880_009057 [Penicillium rolfsii]